MHSDHALQILQKHELSSHPADTLLWSFGNNQSTTSLTRYVPPQSIRKIQGSPLDTVEDPDEDGYKDEDDNGVVFDMPNYTVINTNLNYEISSNLEGYVRVQNLMGSDYETIIDFNTGGRQIFAGVRATF